MGATAAGLYHNHRNSGSEPCLTYTTAHSNAGSLNHWVRPGIEPMFSWMLVRFVNHWAMTGTPSMCSFLYLHNSCNFTFSENHFLNKPEFCTIEQGFETWIFCYLFIYLFIGHSSQASDPIWKLGFFWFKSSWFLKYLSSWESWAAGRTTCILNGHKVNRLRERTFSWQRRYPCLNGIFSHSSLVLGLV